MEQQTNHLSQELLQMLWRIDSEWQGVKGLIGVHDQTAPEEEAPPTPISWQAILGGEMMEETPEPIEPDPPKQPQSSGEALQEPPRTNAAIVPAEAQAIKPEEGKLSLDVVVLRRLEKMERQNRKVVILGGMFFTLMTLTIGVFALLMFRANLLSPAIMFPPHSEIVAQSPQPTIVLPPAEEVAVKTETPVNTASPVKYVGSSSSNKYHYLECKWAKTIHPEKLITFKSVSEAKAAGYIRCPACNPPLSD